MSEQLPHNDEQWNDLSVPDSEISWQKMELLLDQDKKRRSIPFLFWRYAAVALLFIGLAVGGWLWIGSKDTKEQLPASSNESAKRKNEKEKDIVRSDEPKEERPSASKPHSNNYAPLESNEQKHSDLVKPLLNKTVNITSVNRTPKQKKNAVLKSKIKTPSKSKTSPGVELTELVLAKEKTENPLTISSEKKKAVDSLQPSTRVIKDSVQTKDTLKTIVSPPVVNNAATPEQKKKKTLFVWSAGVGLQQSIAVNGQQSSSYNYNGNKSALSDHIPSVYLRLQKGKWFAQAEFQYSAPQPVQNFYFSQKTTHDVANLSINTERFVIQKLYYHQLPISVNYHLLPNLSIGAGGMYNILAGAVTEQEVKTKNVLTGSETTTTNLAPVKGFKDSFLYKTTAGILLQTDYYWKRFSLGLRFTQNLQPFIKYTKPDGTVLDEKTQALQAIVRFRLWETK